VPLICSLTREMIAKAGAQDVVGVSSEEVDHWRALTEKLARIDLGVVLVEQLEVGSAVSDLRRFLRQARGFQLRGRATHRFDCFAKGVVGSGTELKRRFELLRTFIQVRRYLCLSHRLVSQVGWMQLRAIGFGLG